MKSPSHSFVTAVLIGLGGAVISVLLLLSGFAFKSPGRFLLVAGSGVFGLWYLEHTVLPLYLGWVTYVLESLPLGLPLLVLESVAALFLLASWLTTFTHPEYPVVSKVVRTIGKVLKSVAHNSLVLLVAFAVSFVLCDIAVGKDYLVDAVSRLGEEPFFFVTIGVMSASFFAWLPIHKAMQPEPVLDAQRIAQMCASCRDFDPRPYFDDEEVFVGREV